MSVEERLPTLREYIKTLLSDKEKVREELFKLTEKILDNVVFICGWYKELTCFCEFDLDNMSFRKESKEQEYKCPGMFMSSSIFCKDIPVNSFRYKYVFNKSE